MKLEVLRFNSQEDYTLGLLFDVTDGRKFLCYTLEDEYREIKKKGETRIPAGTYPITLRTTGGFHSRYSRKFPDIHKGMLWVRDVPNFEYILIHVGNDQGDTEGCLLVGNTQKGGFIGDSVNGYKKIYPPIADALEKGEQVTITYIDYDTI